MFSFLVFHLSIKNKWGHFQSSCPATMNLLSCSLGNTQREALELFRSIKPLNTTTCECYDNTYASCIAWCTELPVNNFEIVTTYGTGSFDATCPNGTNVLGCHIDPVMPYFGFDCCRNFYPSDDGSGCSCSDIDGANCIATCASDINDYEVVSAYGTNNINVKCTKPGNVVLGCGGSPVNQWFKDYYDYQFELWRMVKVQNKTSCTCYDWFGITCYAICGKIG